MKQPKCKNCKQPFTKTQPLQVACSYSCAIELAKPIAKKVIEKKERENEIDKILSKIGKNGLKDLSTEERKRLDELSKKIK